jgi:3-hydroxybutyryl-CoA dehydrogenase
VSAPATLGVVGAGTMGAGIAQLGCAAGMDTLLHDPVPEALARGAEQVRGGIDKWVERRRMSAEEGEAAAARLRTVESVEELAPCELVIEAAPERPDLKRELFGALSGACGGDTVLATNTSSIPVTSLAGSAEHPENVVGMHFFNPAPVMKLVEVIAAEQSSERALDVARAAGEAMGKRVIDAADGPGFLVNRCGRPFGAEALRLLQERVASAEAIDRICRMGAGFRMGPFELMDLVGIDTGFEVAKSFTELSFGEPRWKPSPIQARMVAAGRLGRKSGRGYYDYAGDGSYRPDDPEPPAPGGTAPAVRMSGPIPAGLREMADEAALELDAPDGPEVVSCAAASLAAQGRTAACGFNVVPPLEESRLVELTRMPDTREETCAAAEQAFAALGFHAEWVGDAPGLVLGRIVCQLVNEALFAVGEGVGSAEDVDPAMELGLNHPRGPIAWARAIGFKAVLATIDALWEERHEERYRAAPMLRRAAA